MGLLGGKESGWTKMPEQKGGKGKGEKIRFYVLDRHNVEKARQSLMNFRGKAYERSIHGLTEDLTKTPYLIRKGHTLHCTSIFPVLSDYLEEGIEVKEKETKEAEKAREKEGKDEQKRLPKTRLASVDKLPKNKIFNEESFNEYKKEFIKEYKDSPFVPSLTEKGQVTWRSETPVSANDVYNVILHTKKYSRSLHINTGTHGNQEGKTVIENSTFAEAKFAKEDLYYAWEEDKISVHIMSKHSGALTEKDYPSIDIIDAWCYSEASQHVIQGAGSSPLASFLQNILQKFYNLSPKEPSRQSSSTLPTHSSSSYSVIGSMTGHAKNTNYGMQAGQATFPGGGDFNFGGGGGYHQPLVSRKRPNEQMEQSDTSPSRESSNSFDSPLRGSNSSKKSRQNLEDEEQDETSPGKKKASKSLLAKNKTKLWPVLEIAERLFATECQHKLGDAKRYFKSLPDQQQIEYKKLAREIREDKSELEFYTKNWKSVSFLTMEKRIANSKRVKRLASTQSSSAKKTNSIAVGLPPSTSSSSGSSSFSSSSSTNSLYLRNSSSSSSSSSSSLPSIPVAMEPRSASSLVSYQPVEAHAVRQGKPNEEIKQPDPVSSSSIGSMTGHTKNTNYGLQTGPATFPGGGDFHFGDKISVTSSMTPTSLASEKPIHFFVLGAVVIGIRIAIAAKDKALINKFYSQIQRSLKLMQMLCPSVDEIEKDVNVLLNPLNDMIYQNEGTLADFYQIGKEVTLIIKYEPNSPPYEESCSNLLEIGNRYDLREKFKKWIDNKSSSEQENWSKMNSIVREWVARRETISLIAARK